MQFNSGVFVAFLLVVLAIYWTLRGRRARNVFLLGASYFFYGWWDWRFVLLLFATSTIDYFVGIGIHAASDARRRKALLWLSIATNVGTLVVFKYFDFFSANLRVMLESVGLHLSEPMLRIVLPVGVSFYTLQAMTYTIDVYRRLIPPCRDYPDFLLFIAYFPPLLAGPISKARHLLPQIQAPRRFDPALASQAIPYIAIGYFYKTVVADNLSGVVSSALTNVRAHSGLELLIVAYCAMYELYGDFAGYSYIAIGVSLLFGIRLPQNFRSPFISQSIREVWTRWHISLVSWFRDYVFYTLIGRRPSKLRVRATVIFTFIVSVLWHGATWTCVAWGLLNGVEYFLPAPFPEQKTYGRILNTIVMVHLGVTTWIFFRVRHVTDALVIVQRIATRFWPAPGEPSSDAIWSIYGWRLVLIASVMTFEIAQRNAQDLPQLQRWPAGARYAFYAALALLYFYRGNFARIPFIYFQF